MGESLKTFEELDCYKECRKVRVLVSRLTKGWPKDEKFRLMDQILRSSRSATANIAEGFGRHHYQENLQYCRQARGSLTETLEHLITAHDEGILNSGDMAEARNYIEAAMRPLNGYITYLSKAASQ